MQPCSPAPACHTEAASQDWRTTVPAVGGAPGTARAGGSSRLVPCTLRLRRGGRSCTARARVLGSAPHHLRCTLSCRQARSCGAAGAAGMAEVAVLLRRRPLARDELVPHSPLTQGGSTPHHLPHHAPSCRRARARCRCCPPRLPPRPHPRSSVAGGAPPPAGWQSRCRAGGAGWRRGVAGRPLVQRSRRLLKQAGGVALRRTAARKPWSAHAAVLVRAGLVVQALRCRDVSSRRTPLKPCGPSPPRRYPLR